MELGGDGEATTPLASEGRGEGRWEMWFAFSGQADGRLVIAQGEERRGVLSDLINFFPLLLMCLVPPQASFCAVMETNWQRSEERGMVNLGR